MNDKPGSPIANYPANKIILYITIVAGVMGSALLSFGIGPFTLSPFRFLVILLWLAFLAGIVINRQGFVLSHVRVRRYIMFLLVWLLYAILSLAWAASKAEAVKSIILLFIGSSVIFFVIVYFTELKDFKRFYYLWLLTLIPIIGIGFWNQITGHQLFHYAYLADLPGAEVTRLMHIPRATFYHENDYATYIALSVPFIATYMKYNSSKLKWVFGPALLLPILYQLLFTNSRANYLAVMLGMAFWFLFFLRAKDKLKLTAVAVLVALLLVIIVPGYTHSVFVKLQSQWTNSFHNSKSNEALSDNTRVNLIKNAFVFLVRSHGFGVGAGNFEYHMRHSRVYDTSWITNAHNWWVEILACYGIFIFIGYLLFYGGSVFYLYKTYRKLTDESEKMICEALLVSLVTFIPASTSPSSIMGFGPQWLLFAFALGFLNYNRITRLKHDA